MKKETGWIKYKALASKNKVSYSTYLRRVKQGMSPLEAATIPPADPREVIIKGFKNGTIKPAMTREGKQVYEA